MAHPKKSHITLPTNRQQAASLRALLTYIVGMLRKQCETEPNMLVEQADNGCYMAYVHLRNALLDMGFGSGETPTITAYVQYAGVVNKLPTKRNGRRLWQIVPVAWLERVTDRELEAAWHKMREEGIQRDTDRQQRRAAEADSQQPARRRRRTSKVTVSASAVGTPTVSSSAAPLSAVGSGVSLETLDQLNELFERMARERREALESCQALADALALANAAVEAKEALVQSHEQTIAQLTANNNGLRVTIEELRVRLQGKSDVEQRAHELVGVWSATLNEIGNTPA